MTMLGTVILADGGTDFLSHVSDYLPSILGVFGAFIPLLLVTLLTQHLKKYTVVWFALFGLLIWIAHLVVMLWGLHWSYAPEMTILLLCFAMVATVVLLQSLESFDRAAGATLKGKEQLEAGEKDFAAKQAAQDEAVKTVASSGTREQLTAALDAGDKLKIEYEKRLEMYRLKLKTAQENEKSHAGTATLLYGLAILLLSLASSNHYGLSHIVMVEIQSDREIVSVGFYTESKDNTGRHKTRVPSSGHIFGHSRSFVLSPEQWEKVKSFYLDLEGDRGGNSPETSKDDLWQVVDRLAFGKVFLWDSRLFPEKGENSAGSSSTPKVTPPVASTPASTTEKPIQAE